MEEFNKSKLNRVKRGANRAVYNKEEINQILDTGFIGYVSYTYENMPITVPMAYGRKGNKIYLHGSQANRMLLSLLKSGKASMTVMHLDALVLAKSGFHHSVNYRSTTVFGSVKNIENDNEKTSILKLIMDHMMKGRWEALRVMNEKELNRTLVVEITIETASAKVRAEGVNDEPEDESLPIWAGLVPIKQVSLPAISDGKLSKDVAIPKHVLDYIEDNRL
ncbi:pyridoxamine 5'-phosphate oxidase family protein [Tenacibaculum sp. 190524A02b]|uniref:Pyridoxamine 5'-phosphate oxidase family protein n=1 Tax=Tenacibaculum vairaonense TaxID=3137860 RepID=A0ABP1FG12_9FLAO